MFRFRSQFEKYIRDKFQIPIVLIVVNGGPGTLETVAQGISPTPSFLSPIN